MGPVMAGRVGRSECRPTGQISALPIRTGPFSISAFVRRWPGEVVRVSALPVKRTYCEQRTNRVHCFSTVGPFVVGLSNHGHIGVESMSSAALRLVEGSSMDKSKALDAALSQIE